MFFYDLKEISPKITQTYNIVLLISMLAIKTMPITLRKLNKNRNNEISSMYNNFLLLISKLINWFVVFERYILGLSCSQIWRWVWSVMEGRGSEVQEKSAPSSSSGPMPAPRPPLPPLTPPQKCLWQRSLCRHKEVRAGMQRLQMQLQRHATDSFRGFALQQQQLCEI